MIEQIRKRLGPRMLAFLGRHEPTHDIALAFAVGAGVSFSPFVGLHWLIALILAWTFRLNKVDVLLGTFVPVNPWTIIPVYSASTTLGWWLLHGGRSATGLRALDWRALSLSSLRNHGLDPFRPYLSSFVVGSLIFSVLGGLATYVLMKSLIRAHRRRRGIHHDGPLDAHLDELPLAPGAGDPK